MFPVQQIGAICYGLAMELGRIRQVCRFPVKSMAGEVLEEAEVTHEGLLGDRAYALRDEKAGEIRGAKRLPQLMSCAARFEEEPTWSHTPPATITLPDGTQTSTEDPAASSRLSALAGRPLTLWPRRPASDKDHYRRAMPGASAAGLLARSATLKKVISRLAFVGPAGEELRRDFGREAGEPVPDMSVFPAELFEFVSPLGTYFDAFPIHLLTTASLETLRSKYPAGDWDPRRFRANFLIETNPSIGGMPESEWSNRILRVGDVELECVVPTPRCSMVGQAQRELDKDPSILRTIVREAAQNLGVYARVRKEGRVAVGDAVELLDRGI